jgi:glycerol-3-phosphate dehydrogenase
VYWLFGNGFTKIPRLFLKPGIQREEPVVKTENAAGGFEYSDAYLHDNDSRFVFQFVHSAMDRGCIAANYMESLGARREGSIWVAHVRDVMNGQEMEIRAKVLINAAGPFVDKHNVLTGEQTEHHHVFSKGIHLIVPQITPHKRIMTFFADDGRLFFVIPMGVRTCIGTTDTRVESPFTEGHGRGPPVRTRQYQQAPDSRSTIDFRRHHRRALWSAAIGSESSGRRRDRRLVAIVAKA